MRTKLFFPARKVRINPSTKSSIVADGFTLVELLAVVAIIAALMALVVPAFNGIIGGRGVAKAVNDVTGIVDAARAQAIARKTGVVIAFKNVTNSDNNSELKIVAFASANGRNDWSLTNLKPITKVAKISKVKLARFENMPKALKDSLTVDIGSSSGPYIGNYWPEGAATYFPDIKVSNESFKDAIYTGFDAEGQVTTSPTSDPYNLTFTTQACILLVPTKGTVEQKTGSDGAVVTIYGGSGKMRVNRP